MANYTRSHSDITSTSDGLDQLPDPAFLPRHVYLSHTGKAIQKGRRTTVTPAVVIQHRDWSNNRPTSVLPTTGRDDGNVIVVRPGAPVSILTEIFAGWTISPKGQIAALMNQGILEVHEDYLGTTRQLTSGQVMQYDGLLAPAWTTFVAHRTKANGTADADPTSNTAGTLAVAHGSVKTILTFTGGTTPTADVTFWHREATQPRGAWIKGETVSGVAGRVETTTEKNGYREVYVQLTGITGSPTGVQIDLSAA